MWVQCSLGYHFNFPSGPSTKRVGICKSDAEIVCGENSFTFLSLQMSSCSSIKTQQMVHRHVSFQNYNSALSPLSPTQPTDRPTCMAAGCERDKSCKIYLRIRKLTSSSIRWRGNCGTEQGPRNL